MEEPGVGSPLVGETQQVKGEKGEEKVKMKKQLGLLEGVAIILGIIIGSGDVDQPNRIMVTFATNRNLCLSKGSLERSWICGPFLDCESSLINQMIEMKKNIRSTSRFGFSVGFSL